jgi:phytoene dehydrogenase-like protein
MPLEMSAERIIIVGAGHNGLVTAFYLARAGLKPLVLERRERVGGAAATEEIAPGFRVPALAHTVGPLRPDIARDLRLEAHGLSLIEPDPYLAALSPDGRAIVFSRDAARTAASIAALSARDAQRYPEFQTSLARVAGVLERVQDRPPPDIDRPSAGDLWSLLQSGRRFRALGRRDGFRLLRWMPMAVADLVGEWFETDLLQAAIAARGIHGAFLGPWSAGSAAILLLSAAFDPLPGGGAATARGGPGALADALAHAAAAAGARIRTGAEVARIQITDGAVAGVVLAGGEAIAATAVVSNADPRRTYLGLIDPLDLEPGFAGRVRNYRAHGTVAKVNLALDGLPSFTALARDRGPGFAGRIHVGPGIDYLERAFDAAKYGAFSEAPYLDVTIPSIADPSLAPPGRHVMSIHAQFAPYGLRGADWQDARDALGDAVLRTLADYAPDLERRVIHRLVLTPVDLERRFGLTGGHIHHGELSLDQLFTMRPMLGWARYRAPVRGLYLCGAGTHPGGGMTGASGRNAAREIVKDMRHEAPRKA